MIAFINSTVLKYTVLLRVGFLRVDVDGGVTVDQNLQDFRIFRILSELEFYELRNGQNY